MATMNVSLPSDMVEFVEHEVSQGGYGSSSEVVREALRLLRHEKAQQAEKLAILRREISIGVEAANAGRFSKKSVTDILDEVMLEQPGR
ncbi:type II toxin-antitoxin system ParD family antitoxin [Mesorhizobium sp. M9A.F.Ca.ET.002.03.1.2]|uniref:type II toxin-antitoxin system ParD family antitoxin n=1 Tax=Mesorhizobium sp. M9A.F.Ca.ET.002.03.1.2 TaxID=2493668 RepID=UPI000F75BF05|nr:type II toxin-antitoxin system ParD family antitoxin [Mesorhizobium sp. M9A.F.Ca.ET.002.03.1.2]AZN99649.1 type II toxin-antitoxin system ParD family antitoxin [Mesorhizobium sp. M9A.F.Ca.ET.002.03.1.2]